MKNGEIPPAKRCELLNRLADIITLEKEDHAPIIVNEMGKPVSQARFRSRKMCAYCAGFMHRMQRYITQREERKSGAR